MAIEEVDSGVDKQKIIREVNAGAEPAAPPRAGAAEPEAAETAPPAAPAGGETTRRRMREFRHEISAVIMVLTGVFWLAMALATAARLPAILGVVFLVPGLFISARYVFGKKP